MSGIEFYAHTKLRALKERTALDRNQDDLPSEDDDVLTVNQLLQPKRRPIFPSSGTDAIKRFSPETSEILRNKLGFVIVEVGGGVSIVQLQEMGYLIEKERATHDPSPSVLIRQTVPRREIALHRDKRFLPGSNFKTYQQQIDRLRKYNEAEIYWRIADEAYAVFLEPWELVQGAVNFTEQGYGLYFADWRSPTAKIDSLGKDSFVTCVGGKSANNQFVPSDKIWITNLRTDKDDKERTFVALAIQCKAG